MKIVRADRGIINMAGGRNNYKVIKPSLCILCQILDCPIIKMQQAIHVSIHLKCHDMKYEIVTSFDHKYIRDMRNSQMAPK